MAPPRFSATLVTYRPDIPLLERALASLGEAVTAARSAGALDSARVFVVDNGPPEARGPVQQALAAWPAAAGPIELLAGHGNVGYGAANNLVIGRLGSDVHLVMNPDVEVGREALTASLAALHGHPDVALVAPAVRGPDGAVEYLCKRAPSVWVLFLRGFAPGFLRRAFARTLERYEMRDVIGERFVKGVPLASGCFMIVRTAAFERLGGFDPGYFMYFEDFDLSLRLAREGALAYEPRARIVHHGGGAARKGARHVRWFVASAWRYFSRHGWKVA